MKEGDVVLAPLPQASGQIKNRPAVILRTMPPYGDFLLCGVNTQLRHEVSVVRLATRADEVGKTDYLARRIVSG